MNINLINYLIESGILLSISYLIYSALLSNETFYKHNRLYLLFSILVSAVFPLIDFTAFNFAGLQQQVGVTFVSNLPSVQLNEIQVGGSEGNFFNYFVNLYFAIVGIFLLKFLFGLFKVLYFIETANEIEPGIFVSKQAPTFTFFNKTVYNLHDYENSNFIIIKAHETAHSTQIHSLDSILAEILCMVQWFNPFARMLNRSLKETHEYLADKAVLEHGFSATEYKLLLANKAIGYNLGLTNQLNQILTLKRFTMITKSKSKNSQRLKYVILLPLVAVMGLFFACNQTETKTDAENTDSGLVVKEATVQDSVYATAEVMPVYPGDENALATDLGAAVVYPEKAKKDGIQGKVYVSFIVNKLGEVTDVKVIRTANDLLNQAAIDAVMKLKKFVPGTIKGEPVSVIYTLPINFKLD